MRDHFGPCVRHSLLNWPIRLIDAFNKMVRRRHHHHHSPWVQSPLVLTVFRTFCRHFHLFVAILLIVLSTLFFNNIL